MERLRNIIRKKGLDWAAAALVYGSIGYYAPPGAYRRVKDILDGIYPGSSERTMACFKNDIEAEHLSDFESFDWLCSYNPEKANRVVSLVKSFLRDMDCVEETALSCMLVTYL